MLRYCLFRQFCSLGLAFRFEKLVYKVGSTRVLQCSTRLWGRFQELWLLHSGTAEPQVFHLVLVAYAILEVSEPRESSGPNKMIVNEVEGRHM